MCVCVQIFTAQRLRNAIYTLLLPDYSVGVLITVMNVSWRHIKISFCVLGARLVWLRKAAHITATRRHRAQLPLYTTVHFYLQRGAEREGEVDFHKEICAVLKRFSGCSGVGLYSKVRFQSKSMAKKSLFWVECLLSCFYAAGNWLFMLYGTFC